MKKERRDIKFEVRFSKSEMERIEKVAKKLEIPKSRLIRNLTLVGLEDAELLQKIGAFELIKVINKMKETLKKLQEENKIKSLQKN